MPRAGSSSCCARRTPSSRWTCRSWTPVPTSYSSAARKRAAWRWSSPATATASARARWCSGARASRCSISTRAACRWTSSMPTARSCSARRCRAPEQLREGTGPRTARLLSLACTTGPAGPVAVSGAAFGPCKPCKPCIHRRAHRGPARAGPTLPWFCGRANRCRPAVGPTMRALAALFGSEKGSPGASRGRKGTGPGDGSPTCRKAPAAHPQDARPSEDSPMSGRPLARIAVLAATVLAFSSAGAQVPLTVELSADTSFTRSFDWSIDKSVVPETADRFIGESQELAWTITATRGDPVDPGFRVVGTISIANPNAEPATITAITLMLGAALVSHDCSTGELAGGAGLACNFDVMVGSGGPQTLSATVTTSGAIAGANDMLGIAFDDPDIANGSITVEDSNLPGSPFVFEDSGSATSTTVAQCLTGDSVVVDNTATIAGTGEDDSEQARVACHTLRLQRNAFAGGGEAFSWEIAKTHAEAEPLLLAVGQSYDVGYTITATAT